MKKSLKHLSDYISEQLGRKIELVSCDSLRGGRQASAYVLTDKNGEKFFLKSFDGKNGNYLHENKLYSAMLGHSMMNNSKASSDSIGIFIKNGDSISLVPNVEKGTIVWHVQKFDEDVSGENHFETLRNRIGKNSIDEDDKKEIEEIVKLLVKIHSSKVPFNKSWERKNVYNDSIQNVLAGQGMFFMFLQDFDENHPVFPRKNHGKYISLMIDIMHKYKDREDRLKSLHGDFWGTNVYLGKRGRAKAVDYSRTPFGDPSIDVASWMVQYLWLFHETGNVYYKNLGEIFLETYKKQTGDENIEEIVSLPLGLMGLIYITPRFYPERVDKKAKGFFKAIWNSLKNKKFSWK